MKRKTRVNTSDPKTPSQSAVRIYNPTEHFVADCLVVLNRQVTIRKNQQKNIESNMYSSTEKAMRHYKEIDFFVRKRKNANKLHYNLRTMMKKCYICIVYHGVFRRSVYHYDKKHHSNNDKNEGI